MDFGWTDRKITTATDCVVGQVYWFDSKVFKVWRSFDAYHCCRVPQDSNCSLSASLRHDLDWLHWIIWLWVQSISLLVAMTCPHEISTFRLFPGMRKVLIQHVDIQFSGRLEPKTWVIASWTQWFAQWVVLLYKSASAGKHCNEITRWCSCWIDHVVSSRVEYWNEWWIIVPWYFMNTCFIEFKSNCRIVARSKRRHRRKITILNEGMFWWEVLVLFAERYLKHAATVFVGGQCARTSTRKAKVYRTGPGSWTNWKQSVFWRWFLERCPKRQQPLWMNVEATMASHPRQTTWKQHCPLCGHGVTTNLLPLAKLFANAALPLDIIKNDRCCWVQTRNFTCFQEGDSLNEYLWEIGVSGVSQMCHCFQAVFLWLRGSAQKESSRGDRTDISNCPVINDQPTSKKTKQKDILKFTVIVKRPFRIWSSKLMTFDLKTWRCATQTPKFKFWGLKWGDCTIEYNNWHCIIWLHVCV